MSDSVNALARRGGVSFLRIADIFIAPGQAFERVRTRAIFWLPFLVSLLLTIVGQELTAPARVHATLGSFRQTLAGPSFKTLSDSEKAKLEDDVAHPGTSAKIVQLFMAPAILLLGAFIQTCVLMLANLFGGRATFLRLWSASLQVAIVSAFGAVVLGVIVAISGPAAYSTAQDVPAAMPGLIYLVPKATGAWAAFLCGINVFSVWTSLLLALALTIIARTRPLVSFGIPGAMLVIGAAFPAILAGLAP